MCGLDDGDIDADELPRVEGDPSKLRPVFQNLLSNAIEDSNDEHPGSTFLPTATARTGSYPSGTGRRMVPTDTDRILEVFQRLHTHKQHSGPASDSPFSFTLPGA